MTVRLKLAALALALASGTALAPPVLAQQADDAITVALPNEPADIDPCNSTVTGIGIVVKENIAETLTVLDPESSTVLPRLATSWTDQGNGVWRVKLRENVSFHDGTPFDAAAVAAAVERLQKPELTCRDRTKIPRVTLTSEVIDPSTIDIKAEPAQPLMPTFLSFIAVPAPNASPDAITRAPVGTGPYRFVDWRPGQGIDVERFDGYWGETPQVAKATYVFRPESALRASMVAIGEADIGTDIAPQDAQDPDLDHVFFNGETTRIRMVMQPPLDDVRVRKALNLAFDREALVGTILSPEVLPATQFFLPKINGYNPDLEVWPYDPEEAAALVEAARADGVPVDKEIRLVGRVNFFPNQEEVLQTMQQMWAAAGLNVRLQMMESAEWLKLVNKPFPADREAMLVQEMHDNNNGDAAFTMPFRYHSDGQQSETAIPALDDLLDRAGSASGGERTRLYREANRMISEDVVPAVPMFHMVSTMRISPRIAYEPNSLSSVVLELADIELGASN